MGERERTAWVYGVKMILTGMIVAGILVYGDQVLHGEGETVRYVGSGVALGVDGCEVYPGESGMVEKMGRIYEGEQSEIANWVMSEDGCLAVIVGSQLEE